MQPEMVNVRLKNKFDKNGKPMLSNRVHSVPKEQADHYVKNGLGVMADKADRSEIPSRKYVSET